MRRTVRRLVAAAVTPACLGTAALVGTAVLAAPGSAPPAPAGTGFRPTLVAGPALPNGAPDIPVAAVRAHVEEFQGIADAHGGDRYTGRPGYRASVDYVKARAEAAGLRTSVQEFRTREGASLNVIAEFPGRDTRRVLLVGAHLDSVDEGPGINDNGSGSAGILAVAEAFAAAQATPERTVRFAWWGAEELGLLGSTHYVHTLPPAERERIAGYLNLDMIASPNPGYFTYGADPALKRLFTDYLATIGVPTETTREADGRSDHAPFEKAGIPAGGLFTGAGGIKTAAQARKWSGRAGAPFDPCYHAACDTSANIDEVALDRNTDAVSFAAWQLAGAGAPTAGLQVAGTVRPGGRTSANPQSRPLP